MGYACPVCGTPQADATHLANHLAFTALIRNDDHEAWLDDHVPGWGERGEAELAEAVVEYAEEEEFPQVFEDTVNEAGEHQHDDERSGRLFEDAGHAHDHSPTHGHGTPTPPPAPMDEETEAIVEEARELTERMLADEEEGEESEATDATTDDAERDEE
ncbi:DUF5810 domain-containing protein [Halomarina litorea]|uniref:DUF5810 domain-containing protein n=1 Tax=Halomarina litorea TaxID=2961595 RepID=UPI0020C2E007|nr:DUF5810 domain-containing protein [Halomarina sp. BCD28]